MPNPENKIPPIPRRDSKGEIWSHIRQAWFVEFPEEFVRQQFVCSLVNDYGFDLAQMDEEISTQRGRQSAEAEIVIWRTVQEKRDAKPPLIVVECKADVREVMQTPLGRSHFQSNARMAVGMWKIGADDITSFPIPIPPLEVQRKLVERVTVARAEIARERAAATALRQTIGGEVEALILGTKPVKKPQGRIIALIGLG